eukprot:TRINITY_DN9046_c0_g1_i1.p1 TRINITY_DN9046_c0_g1~~TRINITY_DN9046_c0_g1_i1.p1  ORF type:complete len:393 (+),score=54.75 TRINITY_DN9046_c0_g1_i1:35-1213(+)
MAHYAALGLKPSASAAEIRSAYLARVRELHPDAAGHGARTAAAFHAVSEAYTVLGDAERRKQYDLEEGVTMRAQNKTADGRWDANKQAGSSNSSSNSSSSSSSSFGNFRNGSTRGHGTSETEAWPAGSAAEWGSFGRQELVRWYTMPVPEFVWRVRGLWCRATGREQIPLDTFTAQLGRSWRARAGPPGRPLPEVLRSLARHGCAWALDCAVNSLSHARRRLTERRTDHGFGYTAQHTSSGSYRSWGENWSSMRCFSSKNLWWNPQSAAAWNIDRDRIQNMVLAGRQRALNHLREPGHGPSVVNLLRLASRRVTLSAAAASLGCRRSRSSGHVAGIAFVAGGLGLSGLGAVMLAFGRPRFADASQDVQETMSKDLVPTQRCIMVGLNQGVQI